VRTVLLSKTDLLRIGVCHRRIAWKRLYQIPTDQDEGNESDAAHRGISFHDLIASALLTEDPSAAFEAGLLSVAPSEHKSIRFLWERHLRLEQLHEPVAYGRTEYQIGMTEVVNGIDVDRYGKLIDPTDVAVTVIARTDVVGRESDQTPAVVEHRTGVGAGVVDELEAALYALSAARLLAVDRVAVHFHALGLEAGPRCDRLEYDSDDLLKAQTLLVSVLTPAARWRPDDAINPQFSVGEWCRDCDFQARCGNYRTQDNLD
jgi:hypothetical protein